MFSVWRSREGGGPIRFRKIGFFHLLAEKGEKIKKRKGRGEKRSLAAAISAGRTAGIEEESESG